MPRNADRCIHDRCPHGCTAYCRDPGGPAPTAPFTDEDRARVEDARDYLIEEADSATLAERIRDGESVYAFDRYQFGKQAVALEAALAYITHLEGALRKLIEGVDRIDSTLDRNHGFADLVASARAALPTSKED